MLNCRKDFLAVLPIFFLGASAFSATPTPTLAPAKQQVVTGFANYLTTSYSPSSGTLKTASTNLSSTKYPELLPKAQAMGATADRYKLFADSNATQRLTWQESYILLAYLEMYEATHDLVWLNYFVKHADGVILQRDDIARRFKFEPVWTTSTDGLHGASYGLTVDTGMITWPLAKFAALVRKEKLDTLFPRSSMTAQPFLSPYPTFESIAVRYLGYTEESVRWHLRREYRETRHVFPGKFTGYFRAREETAPFLFDTRGRPLTEWREIPFNMENALANTIVHLYAATGKEDYLRAGRGLLFNYLINLQTPFKAAALGTYYVDYWSQDNSAEDISHGFINGAFLKAAHENGFDLNEDIVTRYGRLASLMMLKPDDKVAVFVDGSNDALDRDANIFGFWTTFESFSRGILPAARRIYTRLTPTGGENSEPLFFSLSSIIKNSGSRNYGASCSFDSQCNTGICFKGTTCGNRLGNGSGCKRNLECASGICFGGSVCASPAGNTSSCSAHHECASGFCSSGRCTSRSVFGNGSACISDLQCSSGLCAGGFCTANRALGNNSTCSRNEECASGVCFGNKVCAAKLGVSSGCVVDNECSTGICFKNQVCAVALSPPSTCYRNRECNSFKCDNMLSPPSGEFWRPHGMCK